MSSAALPSNVRVFVSFKEDTIFAGEDIEATITFKNIEPPNPPQEKSKQRAVAVPPIHESPASTQLPPSQPTSRPTHSRQASVTSQAGRASTRPSQKRRPSALGHRQTLSLNVLDTSPRKEVQSAPLAATTAPGTPRRDGHGRSVSIVSIGSDADRQGKRTSIQRDPGRPGLKLSRSASVQVTPTTGASSRWGFLGSNGTPKPPPAPSPLATATSAPDGFPWGKPGTSGSSHTRHVSAGAGVPPSPRPAQLRTSSGRIPHASKMPPSSFKFPPSPTKDTPLPEQEAVASPPVDAPLPSASSTTTATPMRSAFPTPRADTVPPVASRLISPERKQPLSRVFSLSSEAGTPRTSTEIYSSSNHSDETMASEIPSAGALLRRPPFLRNSSSLAPPQRRSGPETLMMGFANITGSFRLDGSLVNQGPFEDVKRRAVVGGQGAGGVVGVDQRKDQGGFFGGFNWGNMAESLSIGSFLGSDQQSSLREMKNTAQSDSIPLLSTPKSILFVDLRLAPGESRSYSFSFTLPRGLPPTHKGRAMKVTYNLVVGTQRPSTNSGRFRGSGNDQQIREVEIPFRVFGGCDARGEILGHDLMAPYIILRDQARSSQVELDAIGMPAKSISSHAKQHAPPQSSEADFNSYVAKLLSSPRRNSSTGLISPTAVASPDFPSPTSTSPNSPPHRRQSTVPLPPPPSTRVLVDSAIRLSTQPLPQQSNNPNTTSQTNFTIARAGTPIATLTLSRPALRLGDLLNLTLDFAAAARSRGPRTLVHALSLTLESVETIDPALSLRSASSIDRATRRVWDRRVVGGSSGGALGWCKQWSGSLKVPAHATPSFSTSGVEGQWVVRVEMCVGLPRRPSLGSGIPSVEGDAGSGSDSDARDHGRDASPSSETEHSLARAPSLRRTGSLRKQMSLRASSKPAPRPVPRARVEPADDERAFERSRQLLERVLDDERGVTLAAVRRLGAEWFEIFVPLRVFGGVGIGSEGGAGSGGEGEAERGWRI